MSDTVFVGNLAFSVTEEALRAAFPTSTRVHVASREGRPAGFGYVTFATAEEADRIIRNESGKQIEGREVRLDHQQKRTPTAAPRRELSEPSTTLRVGNLSFEAVARELDELFRPYGVKTCRILSDKTTGRSRGIAFAEFETIEHAQAALNALNGQNFKERALHLDFAAARDPSSSPVAAAPRAARNAPCDSLFVGSLSYSATEEQLRAVFAGCAGLTEVKVITDQHGVARGFGVAKFDTIQNAQAALNAKNGAEVDGRAIQLDFSAPPRASPPAGARPPRRDFRPRFPREARAPAPAAPEAPQPPSEVVFVGNLDFATDEAGIRAAFGQFGTITRVNLPIDRASGRPKGFGHISFASIPEATAATAAMNGTQLGARTIRVNFARPEAPRPERQERAPRRR